MFDDLTSTFILTFLAVVLFMSLAFFIAKYLRRIDFVDAAWGWAFIVIALTSYILRPLDTDLLVWGPPALVTTLVVIWGMRLSWHILKRIMATKHEDPRYVELRSRWKGDEDINTFFRIYMVQAVLAFVISLPVIYINMFGLSIWQISWEALSPIGKFMWLTPHIGAGVWVIGFVTETIADRQLRKFQENPKHKGKLMQTGLWKYSRHPNYFGELLQWWGIFLMALSVPYGWVTIVGPLTLTYLLLFVSGIPLNERRFNSRPGWSEYKQRTSVLVPLPPKRA